MIEKKDVGENVILDVVAVQEVVVVRPTEKITMTAIIAALIVSVVAVVAFWNVTVVSLSKDCCNVKPQVELVTWRNDRYTQRSWNPTMVTDYRI